MVRLLLVLLLAVTAFAKDEIETFKVVSPQGKTLKTINLESSAVIREFGTPYVLGANLAKGAHRNFGIFWKELPPYPTLKRVVIRAAKGELDGK